MCSLAHSISNPLCPPLGETEEEEEEEEYGEEGQCDIGVEVGSVGGATVSISSDDNEHHVDSTRYTSEKELVD